MDKLCKTKTIKVYKYFIWIVPETFQIEIPDLKQKIVKFKPICGNPKLLVIISAENRRNNKILSTLLLKLTTKNNLFDALT